MTKVQELLELVRSEVPATKEMLDRIPDDKLDWKPHEKSMTLGELSGLVADMFGWFAMMVGDDELDFATAEPYPKVAKSKELLELLDKRLAETVKVFEKSGDDVLGEKWTMRHGDQIFLETEKGKIAAQTVGHLAHHRGQLSVYLRLLDVPVPEIYGPTADENSWSEG